MVGPFFNEAAFFIVFCHVFVNGEDLLEIFRPNPSLPQELNEWLAEVQEHKGDFRLIRESIGEEPKNLFHFNDDYEDTRSKKEDFASLNVKDKEKDQQSESLDDRPQNDIYPYMFQHLKDNNLASADKTSLKTKRLSSKNLRSPIRLRRSFLEDEDPINVQPASKIGELKRSDQKYPDSYNRNEDRDTKENAKIVNNDKEEVKLNELKKREIQIDIKNDGKLVKQIHEDTKSPKSIILNIQSPQPGNPKMFEPNLNVENNYKAMQQNYQDPNSKIKNIPDLNSHSEYNRIKSKEQINTFNNLYTANEHLNTDNSLAHESSTSGQMIHHMPQPEWSSGHAYPYNQQHNYEPVENNKQLPRHNDFNNNNMQDMSSYWTAVEKNEMQKGLDRARTNNAPTNIKPSPKAGGGYKVKESSNGFEPAQRIELDSDVEDSNSAGIASNVDAINEANNLRKSCGANCFNSNSMNNPNCAGCVSGVNAMNNMSVFRDTNINSINNLNGIKDLNSSNSLIGVNNIPVVNGLNGFSYDLGMNQQLNGDNFNNTQGILRIHDKRQLEGSDENLGEINSNLDSGIINFVNTSDQNNVYAYNAEYIPDIKRNDDDLQQEILEQINPSEADNSTSGLNEEFPRNSDVEENMETLSLVDSPKAADEVVLENEAEPLPHKHNQAEPIVIENAVEGNNHVPSENKIEPNESVEEMSDEAIHRAHEAHEEPEHLGELPESHHANKHFKTIINTVTQMEIVTEIQYPEEVEKEEELEQENVNENECEEPETENNNQVIELEPCQKPHENEEEAVANSCHHEPHTNVEEVHHHHHENHNEDEEEAPLNMEHHHHHQNEEEMHHTHENHHGPILQENRLKNEINMPFSDSSADVIFNNNFEEKKKGHAHFPINWAHHKHDNAKKKKHFNKKHSHNPSSVELMMYKRDNTHPNHPKKGYKKKHHKDKILFHYYEPQEYENVLNEEDISNIDVPSNSGGFIPTFIGRHLQTADYVYDAYLHRPGVNLDEDLSAALQRIELKKNQESEHLHKNSVEGDYGEEEDSVTEAQKKNSNTIIKKTENELANPVTTTEAEDYDNYEDYDNVKPIKREKVKPEHVTKRHKKKSTEKPRSRDLRKRMSELKGHDVKDFAHHGQKFKHKIKTKHPHPVAERRRSYSGMNKLSRRNFIDTNSEFQHWPNFVVEDRQNEEQLRKRSPVLQKKYPRAFNFPLSSNDFFVKSQKKFEPSESKRDKPSSLLDEENPSNESKLEDPYKVSATTEKALNSTETTGLDEDTDACSKLSAVTNACEDKENFNKTVVQITTILSIGPESSEESQVDGCNNNNNNLDVEANNATSQEKLDDILNGKLPFQLMYAVMEKMAQNSKLKSRFHNSLRQGGPDKNVLHGFNETNVETEKMMETISSIVNKLKYTATCQSLPQSLRRYLKLITRGNKMDALAKTREMEEVEFDENQNENNFIFESSSHSDNFEGKVKVLQDLLTRFNNLPDRCKARAMPVKEYIENHLGMLNNMLHNMSEGSEKNTKPKKSIEPNQSIKSEDELIQEQLESLGLGKQKKFKPGFDLDQMVEDRKQRKASTNSQNKATETSRNVNVNKRDLNTITSKNYDKLVDAVRRLRLRREGEKRLGEMYGRSRESNDYNGFFLSSKDGENEDLSKANFESPLVYSL